MKYITILFTLILISSCGQNNQEENKIAQIDTTVVIRDKDNNVIKVYIDHSGVIFTDNQQTTLNELDIKIKALKDKQGTVYYSRDNFAGDPPKEAMEVIDVIAKYELPIKFYIDKEFTQVADFK
jgi:biopolymer transport protein ExbD